jgi:hypothetical protein
MVTGMVATPLLGHSALLFSRRHSCAVVFVVQPGCHRFANPDKPQRGTSL